MPNLNTVESILELRDTARYLYAGISANVVILSPILGPDAERFHWVFDESFDNIDSWNVPFTCWAMKNPAERYGSMFDRDMKAIWEWFNARRLSVAQVVFSYPNLPRF
jgi:hypothetical protein